MVMKLPLPFIPISVAYTSLYVFMRVPLPFVYSFLFLFLSVVGAVLAQINKAQPSNPCIHVIYVHYPQAVTSFAT